ncbi:MAG: PQQ-dependent sugar dehydrogenase [Actinomycetota bacterium]|nr:PQQ-dependent sugar dehydrogenase [Actinomycetota bacterium]
MKISPKVVSTIIVAALALLLAPQSNAKTVDLEIFSVDAKVTQVEGSRGAALAVLADGTLLLGGGERGDSLFQYQGGQIEVIGKISTQSERLRDSRFGPTDIAILNEREKSATLLISYPQLNQKRRCVRLVVFQYEFDRAAKTVEKGERWFQGKPCVPISAVQHAAGRIAVINGKSAYLTTGDLGFTQIDERKLRGRLGGVFKITKNKVLQISSGHRNPQGILLADKRLYISEHGPRGGDELNLIKRGRDYGWPFVTYGQAYSLGDYIRPTSPGTHKGFEEPIYQWTPSVAPTELLLLPTGERWKNYSGWIAMGTLAEQSLIFIEILNLKNKSSDEVDIKIGKVLNAFVGERIRDMDLTVNGELVATTDSGKLLFISL